jgi:hypothetical protein
MNLQERYKIFTQLQAEDKTIASDKNSKVLLVDGL